MVKNHEIGKFLYSMTMNVQTFDQEFLMRLKDAFEKEGEELADEYEYMSFVNASVYEFSCKSGAEKKYYIFSYYTAIDNDSYDTNWIEDVEFWNERKILNLKDRKFL